MAWYYDTQACQTSLATGATSKSSHLDPVPMQMNPMSTHVDKDFLGKDLMAQGVVNLGEVDQDQVLRESNLTSQPNKATLGPNPITPVLVSGLKQLMAHNLEQGVDNYVASVDRLSKPMELDQPPLGQAYFILHKLQLM